MADLRRPSQYSVWRGCAKTDLSPARDHVVLPFTGPLMEVHRRAAVRGEIAATALTPRVTMVGPDLLLAHAIVDGPAASTAVVTEIVDLVLLPLLRGYASPST
jgi:hypothetical protein